VRLRQQILVGAIVVALFAAISGTGVLGLLALALGVGVAIGLRISPGLLVALALAATMFSTRSALIGLPIEPERLFLAAGLATLAVGLPFGHQPLPRLRWRAVHGWMLLAVGIVILSMLATSWRTDNEFFLLLDDFGIAPYLLFTLAPLLYPSDRERSHLAVVLVAVGWYLAVTAFLEGIGLKALTWPTYINDPAVGEHFDRARGPFVESTIMGLGLLGGVTGAIVALQIWRGHVARWLAGLLIPFGLLGCIFTLTRSVWLGSAAFLVVTVLAHPRTRRFAVPALAAGLVGVVLAFALVPGLRASADARASDSRPVWDRLNNNRAAVETFKHHPLTGLGWGRNIANPYLRQADTYPLTGGNVVVHNIVLSNLAQLGLVGFLPWLAVLVLGVVVPAVRRGPPAFEPWRRGLQAYAVAWFIVGMFAPLIAPFPNYLLWLLAGIVATPMTSVPPLRADEPVAVASA
jgi:O-antigen ligase